MNRLWTKAALSAVVLWSSACTTPPPDVDPARAGAGPKWSAASEARRLDLSQALRNSSISAVRNKDDQLQFNLPSDFAFDSDSADIKPDMLQDLDHLASSLNSAAVRRMRLLVVGYTDNQGSNAVNDPLSLARAYRVAQHIQNRGVDAARITVEGRGEREPMVSNTHSYGRALNRRVEIVLIEPLATPAAGAPR